jgi:hypothetical protein
MGETEWSTTCSSSLWSAATAFVCRAFFDPARVSPLGASSSGLLRDDFFPVFLVQGCGMTEESQFWAVSTGSVALISSGSLRSLEEPLRLVDMAKPSLRGTHLPWVHVS